MRIIFNNERFSVSEESSVVAKYVYICDETAPIGSDSCIILPLKDAVDIAKAIIESTEK